ncbi:hypothetical protein [Pseudomonas sp. dw_358]|uniref:hypothetical protein n=1 Tax=Pseudomonas sp. dw_358 TaxID=2720083 RepID=UPI001BD32802|nr:hypothetical protein [Pseudomonas sp. dw_358]
MTHTLVAAFDTLADAQAAKSELLIQQVLESNIHLSLSAEPSAEHAAAAGDASDAPDDSIGRKISHFFSSLFGNDEENKPHRYAVAYPEAYRRGATVLTVTAITDEQADQVEDILERNGAIDIDERFAAWSAEGSDASATTHIAGTHLGIDRSAPVDRNLDTPAGQAAFPVSGEDLLVSKPEPEAGRGRVVSRVPERSVERPADLDIEADPSSTVHQETFDQPPVDPPKDR